MTRAEHLAAVAQHLDRAAQVVKRFHSPIGIQQTQLLAAQLDLALANAHSLAALALIGVDAETMAALLPLANVDITPPEPEQPGPSGLIVPA